MGETIDSEGALPGEHKSDDKFYFFDEERLKERLGGGDGPSFSVASLFSSKSAITRDEPSINEPRIAKPTTAPAPIFMKQSLFILDPTDSRIADVGKFFSEQAPFVDPQDLKNRRREIHLIVQNKFKRVERNQDKMSKSGSNKYGSPRRNFKKRKT